MSFSLDFILAYSAITLLGALALLVIWQLIKGSPHAATRTFWYLLNLGVMLFFCYGLYVKMASIVTFAPKYPESKTRSTEDLQAWIIREEMEYALIGPGIILVLAVAGYGYQKWLLKTSSVSPILRLALIDLGLLVICLAITYVHTFSGLHQEMLRHFE